MRGTPAKLRGCPLTPGCVNPICNELHSGLFLTRYTVTSNGEYPNIPQSLAGETWQRIRVDHAEASRESLELELLPGNDSSLPYSREAPGSRL